MNYYNEIDPYCAQWLRNLIAANLIPDGHVDQRDIRDVTPNDLKSYTQCHFFAGLGGWPLALQLAAIPPDRPLWTGSCPCQPFSAAGARRGFADERHLWPFWHHLISINRPPVVLGEQVAKAADWLALVRSDLEALDYAVGAMPIEAASAGADHKRDRYWLIAHAAGDGCKGLQQCAAAQIPENWAFETLASRNAAGDSFANWRELLARSEIRCLPDGVSSNMAVRPTLRAIGNAIDPYCAAAFIKAAL